MKPIEVQAAMAEAVGEVLETMCFTAVLSSSDAAIPMTPECKCLIAALRFEGGCEGEFRVCIPMALARQIGAGFLGEDEEEISDVQAGEFVCELGNMFCGSALSRLEPETIFHLSHPELIPGNADAVFDDRRIGRWFELEEGNLAASMGFRQG